MSQQPTRQTFEELEKAFTFFNDELFEGRLPHCMITLQRQHDTFGYFSANQFQNHEQEQVHEIALNPSFFSIRPIPETLSVLVREMVSLDQTVNTPPEKRPRRRYRNKEWAAMVKAVGLAPTSTGQPGGKETGDSVQTYIIEDGPFDRACTRLVDEDFTLSWIDRFPPRDSALLAVLSAPAPIVQASPHGVVVDGAALGGDGRDITTDESATGAGQESSVLQEGDSTSHEEGGMLGPSSIMPAGGLPAPAMKRFDPVPLESLESKGIEFREAAKSTNKTKFSCPVCKANAWGKKSLRLNCVGTDDVAHADTRMTEQQ